MSIKKLREKLLETIERLEAGTIKKEDALAISQISQTYLNSIKTEVEVYKAAGIQPALTKVLGKAKPQLSQAMDIPTTSALAPTIGDHVDLYNGDRVKVIIINNDEQTFIGKNKQGYTGEYSMLEIKI